MQPLLLSDIHSINDFFHPSIKLLWVKMFVFADIYFFHMCLCESKAFSQLSSNKQQQNKASWGKPVIVYYVRSIIHFRGCWNPDCVPNDSVFSQA